MVFGKGRPNRLVLGDSAGDSQCATIVAPDEIVDAEVPVATNVALEPEIGDDNRKLGPPSGPLSPAFDNIKVEDWKTIHLGTDARLEFMNMSIPVRNKQSGAALGTLRILENNLDP
ncbi:hypothetical protein PSTT_08548, partial [Puccinia striiformis]